MDAGIVRALPDRAAPLRLGHPYGKIRGLVNVRDHHTHRKYSGIV